MNPLALLGVLAKVPPAAYLLAAALAWGWWGHHTSRVANEELAVAQSRVNALSQTLSQQTAAREEENRRVQAQAEVAKTLAAKAEQERAAAQKDRAAASAARDAVDRLLDYVKRPAPPGAGPGDPSAVSRGEAADRLGTVAKECLGRFEQVAADAVDAVIRGQRCSGSYDALNKK